MNVSPSRILLLAAIGLHGAAFAAPPEPAAFESFTTDAGCEVRMPTKGTKLPSFTPGRTTWDGRCEQGLAEGFGTFEYRQAATGSELIFSYRTHLAQGRPVGYALVGSVVVNGAVVTASSAWMFFGDDFSVGSRVGMGLSIDEAALRADRVPLPTPVPTDPRAFDMVSTRDRVLSVMQVMTVDSTGEPKYQLVEMPKGPDGAVHYQLRKEINCPAPATLASCKALIESMVAPYQREVVASIDAARPAVDARLRSLPGRAKPIPAVKAPGSAGAAELAGLGAVDLYLRADAQTARGDKEQGRKAAAELIRRYPDHPLAKPVVAFANAAPAAAAGTAPSMAATAAPAPSTRPRAEGPAGGAPAQAAAAAPAVDCSGEVTAFNRHHRTTHGPDHGVLEFQYPSFQLRAMIAEIEAQLEKARSVPDGWDRRSAELHRSLELCRAREQLAQNTTRDRVRKAGPLPGSKACVAEVDRIGTAALRARPQGMVDTARVATTVAERSIEAVRKCPADPYLDQLVRDLEQSAAAARKTCAMTASDVTVCAQRWAGL